MPSSAPYQDANSRLKLEAPQGGIVDRHLLGSCSTAWRRRRTPFIVDHEIMGLVTRTVPLRFWSEQASWNLERVVQDVASHPQRLTPDSSLLMASPSSAWLFAPCRHAC
jgi:hypothetical protein